MVSNDCLSYFDSIEVVGFPVAKSFSLGGDQEIRLGESVYLEPDIPEESINIIEWFVDGNKLECDNCTGVNLNPIEDVKVLAVLIDRDGCEQEDEINISVNAIREVYQANVFTPNNDGVNDRFYLQTATIATVQEIRIFNRWGNLVFEKYDFPTNDQSQGWNGNLDERTMRSNVFVYTADIVFPDGAVQKITGEILMISN